MSEVSKTLAERGARYGEFIDHATIAQGIQEVMLEAPNWWRLKPDVRQMLVVLSDKVARILNGDPDYTDNYHDIQGYAKLVEDRLLKEQKAADPKNAKLFEDEEKAETVPVIEPFPSVVTTPPWPNHGGILMNDGPRMSMGPDAAHHSHYYYDTDRNR